MTATTLDISDARKELSHLADRLRDERVIRVTRHGKDAFAVVDLEYLEAVMETVEILSDPDAFRLFQQSIDDINNGRVIDHEELREEFG